MFETFPPDLLALCGVFLLIAVLIAFSLRAVHREQAIARRLTQVRPPDTLLDLHSIDLRWQVCRLGERQLHWKRGVLLLTPDCCTFYQRDPRLSELYRFTPAQLRWFGRPHKYTYGYNEIWLHVESEAGWQLIKLRLYRDAMQQLVRALKVFAAPELVEAYRRRRPYIHYGPVSAQPAAQDIHGGWTLAAPVQLYLMPRFLLILNQGTVLRKILLEAVQQVGALRRLDAPRARGLVRFRAEEETFAFAVDQHEATALALAEAAKRTLEAPIERKQKAKDDAYPEVEDQRADEMQPKRLSL